MSERRGLRDGPYERHETLLQIGLRNRQPALIADFVLLKLLDESTNRCRILFREVDFIDVKLRQLAIALDLPVLVIHGLNLLSVVMTRGYFFGSSTFSFEATIARMSDKCDWTAPIWPALPDPSDGR